MTAAPDVAVSEGDLEYRARIDLPYSARCFGGWLRARLVEHWAGDRCWHEIDRGDFGILRRDIHPDRFLVADVVALLLTGGENLTIIAWALETNRNLDDVVAILTLLDLNAHRVTRFAWLPPATPVAPRLRLARSS
ncbi:MAG: hypothetical protein IT294_03440 [Deltaproteobacteria bacterium]|nr:hypothetical protein [Deltaproteobacteria bacterium]